MSQIRDANGNVTKAYRKWTSMNRRCVDTRHPAYSYYGGRGIKVCDRWLKQNDGFTNFLADMSDPPPGKWLERINNDGNYEPSNCKWATPKEQAANRRPGGNRPHPDSMRQLSIKAGLAYHVVYLRVKRLGWTIAEALNTPARFKSDSTSKNRPNSEWLDEFLRTGIVPPRQPTQPT